MLVNGVSIEHGAPVDKPGGGQEIHFHVTVISEDGEVLHHPKGYGTRQLAMALRNKVLERGRIDPEHWRPGHPWEPGLEGNKR